METVKIERKPAEVFHVIEFIDEELDARGWTRRDLADRMGGDAAVNELSLELLELKDPSLYVGLKSARQIARVFGTSIDFWLNLDDSWRRAQPEPTITGPLFQ